MHLALAVANHVLDLQQQSTKQELLTFYTSNYIRQMSPTRYTRENYEQHTQI